MRSLSIPCFAAVGAVAALATLGGCGLIDSDITQFDLSLPEKEFTVDSNQWEIQGEGQSVPEFTCTPSPDPCPALATQLCTGTDCFAQCGDNGACEVFVVVNLFDTVDLAAEAPELSSIDGQPLLEVTLQRVFFDVLENTLTIDTPEMGVYVAPESVTRTQLPQALLIGTIPPVPAGMTISNQEMTLAPDGNENLQMFMSDFQEPFNIIVGTTIEVEGGEEVPAGRLRASVGADASAGL